MQSHDKNRMLLGLRDLVCGILIGAGAILPGVSGGVLAVVFDVYRPFMEVMTYPRTAVPKYWKMLATVSAGGVVGFLAFARGITAALNFSSSVTTSLFVGLIVGTIPALFHEAGREGRTRWGWVSLAVCMVISFPVLYYVSDVATIQVAPSTWWYVVSGGMMGLGSVVPGLSSTPILMALGLYKPLLQGMSDFDFSVLVPAAIGVAVTVVLLARVVSWLFRRHYSPAFHGILGLVAASTLVIIPTRYANSGEMILSAVFFAGGLGLGLLLGWGNQKIRGDQE